MPAWFWGLAIVLTLVAILFVVMRPKRRSISTRLERRVSKQSSSLRETEPDTPRSRQLDENVQFTVYRPKTVQPNKWYTLLAFAHLEELPPDAAKVRVASDGMSDTSKCRASMVSPWGMA